MQTKQQWLDRFNGMSMLELAEIWEQHIDSLHPELLSGCCNNFTLEQDIMAAELADLMITLR